MTIPKVFISYSHDSETHKQWVLRLATSLRENGVNTVLDQWDLSLGQDVSMFMDDGIKNSDRVLLVCTKNYVDKADAGKGGVGYERQIVTAEMVQSIDTIKFIPVLINNAEMRVPSFLGARLHIDFTDESKYDSRLKNLIADLHNLKSGDRPPLGDGPAVLRTDKIARPVILDASPAFKLDGASLDQPWFDSERAHAEVGLKKLGFSCYMELRIGSEISDSYPPKELLNAVRNSRIDTFGWPIGVMLENRREYAPNAFKDGIKAEIAIDEDMSSSRISYDYWVLRQTAEFFLIQSLFEDSRVENAIFFNTRIVRVTEAILFACRLYNALGQDDLTTAKLRVRYFGFRDRVLTTSNPARSIRGNESKENESDSEVSFPIGIVDNHDEIVKNVIAVCAPFFQLFGFQEFDESVYHDIVTQFIKGNVT